MGIGENLGDAVKGFVFIVFLFVIVATLFVIGSWELLACIALAAVLTLLSITYLLQRKAAKRHNGQAKSPYDKR